MAEVMHELLGSLRDSQPEVARICTSIASFLSSIESNAQLHLTYSILKRESRPENDVALMSAVQFLIGAKADILEMQFEFVDDEGEYFPLSKAAIAHAQRTGELEHPYTGDMVADYGSSVLVYFVPTQRATEILMHHRSISDS